MQRALDLATKGRGTTAPNPMVGCVIVKRDEVIGEGYHAQAGKAHAEVEAISACRESTQGATLYVTLEPCCHVGRTAACTVAIREAGISRVVYAVDDPNPLVDGGGRQALINYGIEVESGLLAEEARELNRAFLFSTCHDLPFVTIKVGMSLDGKTATQAGESKWITSTESRALVHQLRAEVGAILVGSGTVLADNPRLDVRVDGHSHSNPMRVIADSRARVRHDARIFQKKNKERVIWAICDQPDSQERSLVAEKGVEIWQMPRDDSGQLALVGLLERLHREKVVHLLCESGGTLVDALVQAGLANEIWAFVAPKLIGGSQAPTMCDGVGILNLKHALPLEWRSWQAVGPDLLIKARLKAIER